MARMSRTTIMADDALLDELREIAAEEGVSLGEVIRQGLEWRAKTRPARPELHRQPSRSRRRRESRRRERVRATSIARVRPSS